jgi:hypothetical protein
MKIGDYSLVDYSPRGGFPVYLYSKPVASTPPSFGKFEFKWALLASKDWALLPVYASTRKMGIQGLMKLLSEECPEAIKEHEVSASVEAVRQRRITFNNT